uniref:C2H2-type domain-containing protein n=1 Tax=Eptatretus burgeri TaxID=7764 RepID=A0A8C4QZI9_EPTBU
MCCPPTNHRPYYCRTHGQLSGSVNLQSVSRGLRPHRSRHSAFAMTLNRDFSRCSPRTTTDDDAHTEVPGPGGSPDDRWFKILDVRSLHPQGDNTDPEPDIVRVKVEAELVEGLDSEEHRTLFSCWKCPKSFSTENKAHVHLKMHSGDLANNEDVPLRERSYPCPACNKLFVYEESIPKHMKLHTKQSLSKCPVCQIEFTRVCDFWDHIYLQSERHPFQCHACQTKLESFQDFCEHMKIHIWKLQHTCSHCEVTLSSSWDLKKHMKSHVGKCSYNCNLCRRKYTQPGSLMYHMKSHNFHRERQHKCNVCGNAYWKLTTLNNHMMTHTGEYEKDQKEHNRQKRMQQGRRVGTTLEK